MSLGNLLRSVELEGDCSLEESEENFEGEDKKEFLRFVRFMLQWRPEDEKTARQLLWNPWLRGLGPKHVEG